MKYEHGDKKDFGTYWSERGPIRIDISQYVYDETINNWVSGYSPRGVEIIKETAKAH